MWNQTNGNLIQSLSSVKCPLQSSRRANTCISSMCHFKPNGAEKQSHSCYYRVKLYFRKKWLHSLTLCYSMEFSNFQ